MDTIESFAPEQIDCSWGTGSELFWSPTELRSKIYWLFFSCACLVHSELHSVYQICSTTLQTFTAGAAYRRSSAWQSQRGFLLGMDILSFSKSDTDKPRHRDIFRQRLPDKLMASITINIFLFPQVSWRPWDKEASTWIQLAFAMDQFICSESITHIRTRSMFRMMDIEVLQGSKPGLVRAASCLNN